MLKFLTSCINNTVLRACLWMSQFFPVLQLKAPALQAHVFEFHPTPHAIHADCKLLRWDWFLLVATNVSYVDAWTWTLTKTPFSGCSGLRFTNTRLQLLPSGHAKVVRVRDGPSHRGQRSCCILPLMTACFWCLPVPAKCTVVSTALGQTEYRGTR